MKVYKNSKFSEIFSDIIKDLEDNLVADNVFVCLTDRSSVFMESSDGKEFKETLEDFEIDDTYISLNETLYYKKPCNVEEFIKAIPAIYSHSKYKDLPYDFYVHFPIVETLNLDQYSKKVYYSIELE